MIFFVDGMSESFRERCEILLVKHGDLFRGTRANSVLFSSGSCSWPTTVVSEIRPSEKVGDLVVEEQLDLSRDAHKLFLVQEWEFAGGQRQLCQRSVLAGKGVILCVKHT